MNEQDDLLRTAVFQKHAFSTRKLEVITAILNKKKLTAEDREIMWLYMQSGKIQYSVKTMKEEIFRKIGFTSSNAFGTINRVELEAIYTYIKSI